MSDIKKSGWPTVVNSTVRGADPVDLQTHLLSKQDVEAQKMKEYIKSKLNINKFDIQTILLMCESNDRNLELFKKTDDEMYSGVLKAASDGQVLQEFNNQSLDIICSIICVKEGGLLTSIIEVTPKNYAETMDKMHDVLEKQDTQMMQQPIQPEIKSVEEELRSKINANGIDSLLETSDTNLVKKLMVDDEPKIKVKIEDNEITITLFKSKESEMGFTDELKKALNSDEEKQQPKKDDPSKKDVLSEVEPEQEDQNPAINSQAKPQDDMNSSDDEINRKQEPKGGDDSNSLPGPNLNGNTGGIQAQEDEEEGIDNQNKPMGTEGMMNDKMADQGIDNHEYIKMTTHAAGKQYWYRDPMTGQIHEKPNAPEGHADFDHSTVLTELIQKVDQLTQQLGQLMGNEEGSQLIDEDGDGDPLNEESGADSLNGEDQGLEAQEEELGMDLDGDNEQGEAPEHQEKVIGDKQAAPAAPKAAAPKAPAAKPQADKKPAAAPAKPKPDFDKMKKSLKAKYPTLSDDKITEVLNKALTPALLAREADEGIKAGDGQSTMEPTEGDIGESAEAKGDSDEGNTETKKKKVEEEKQNLGEVGGDPANKQGNAFDKINKSKFERMWKVFKIDMPETLAKSEDFSKANDGLKKLQKCIMKQGKSESEANKIVNRAVIEKYDLLNKGKKNFQNYDEYVGSKNFNTGDESKSTIEEMQQLRKSDSEARFGVREYSESKETLVIEKSTNINQQISQVMNPDAPKWDYKEFQGEKLEKSSPTERQVSQKKEQDSRWNVPTWKGSERDIKDMVIAKSQSINERILNDDIKKSQNTKFQKYPEYSEEKTKLEKSEKTESELMQEAVIKRNWKE